jgi:hypothetical protein
MENHDQHSSEHCDEMLREQFNDRREFLPPAAVVEMREKVSEGDSGAVGEWRNPPASEFEHRQNLKVWER